MIAGLAVGEGLHADLGPLAAAYVLFLAAASPILARYRGGPSTRGRPSLTAEARDGSVDIPVTTTM